MFILVTIIIFGIFVVIAYWLFEDQIRDMLSRMMSTTDEVVTTNLKNTLELTDPAGRGLTP